MNRCISIQVGILLAVGLTACAKGPEPARIAALSAYFATLAQNQEFNGDVLVADYGRVVFERSFGYADFASRRRNTSDVRFPIASISKVLTGTAILQLAEAGTLRMGDPVVEYLPGFPYPTVTVRHLLSHTSGLPPYNAYFDFLRAEQPERVFTNADFLPGLRAGPRPLIYQPGEKGSYDNINFIVLAAIIEKASGTPYDEYIARHVLRPAGMRDTRFLPLGLQFRDSTSADLAFPHIYPHVYSAEPIRAGTIPYVVSYWNAYRFAGFGDYVSTTRDLLRLDDALYHGRLLSGAMLREAYTPVRLNDGTENPDRFGLGWEIEKDTSLGTIVYHSGAATGLSCVLLRNVSRHQTVIVFDNAHYNAHEIATNALLILNGRQVPRPKKSITRVFGMVLASTGPEAARDTLEKLRDDTATYALSEGEINSLGYDFMATDNPYHLPMAPRYADALAVFEENVHLFPRSANVYDSYGEALLATGKVAEALRMYERALDLNPQSINARKMVAQLRRTVRN